MWMLAQQSRGRRAGVLQQRAADLPCAHEFAGTAMPRSGRTREGAYSGRNEPGAGRSIGSNMSAPTAHAAAITALETQRSVLGDAAADAALSRWQAQARAKGVRLRLSGVTPENRHGRTLAAHGQLAPWQAEPGLLHADADLAIEAAEIAALADAGLPAVAPPCALVDCALFEGLAPADAQALAARMPARALAAGERLFARGDPGDALYVITAGSVSVRDPATGQRYVSFSAGMCFGETAVLDPQGRTADAVADEASVVHPLGLGLLSLVERESPQVAARLHRNLARHLSRRLREAAAAWTVVAG